MGLMVQEGRYTVPRSLERPRWVVKSHQCYHSTLDTETMSTGVFEGNEYRRIETLLFGEPLFIFRFLTSSLGSDLHFSSFILWVKV